MYLAAIAIVAWAAWILPRGRSSKVVVVPLDAPAQSIGPASRPPPAGGDPGEAAGIVEEKPSGKLNANTPSQSLGQDSRDLDGDAVKVTDNGTARKNGTHRMTPDTGRDTTMKDR